MARKWRTIDIVFASVLAAVSGVMIWAWGLFTSVALFPLLTFFQPLESLADGGWLFPGVLGGLIIRKPGAAFFTELLAAIVAMMLGSQWGFEAFMWGAMQGLGTELVFALFRYKKFTRLVAVLAGVGAALGGAVLSQSISFVAWEPVWRITALVATCISGAILAGFGSYQLTKKLVKTGVLDRFAVASELELIDND
ncbi:MAG: ECF transporter S component [Micrococcaceae bacterium]